MTAFRAINSDMKSKILKKFQKSELMDLRKVSNNFGTLLIEHNPNPLNRSYSNFFVRFKITLKYIILNNFLVTLIFFVFLFYILN